MNYFNEEQKRFAETEKKLEGEVANLNKELLDERGKKEQIAGQHSALQKELDMTRFTLELLEQSKGQDASMAELKKKYEDEVRAVSSAFKSVFKNARFIFYNQVACIYQEFLT